MSKFWWVSGEELSGHPHAESLNSMMQWMQATSYKSNQSVYSSSLPGDVVFVMGKGEAQVLQKTAAGTERELTRLLPGDFFGSLSFISKGHKNIRVLVLKNAEMQVLRKQAFEYFLSYKPKHSAQLVEFIAEIESRRNQSSQHREHSNIQRRLRRLLLHYLNNQNYTIAGEIQEFNYRPAELAQLIGCPLKALDKCIQDLIQKEIIQLTQGKLTLLDRQSLNALG